MHFIANTLNHCHTTESLPRLKALTYIRQGISSGFSARWKRLLLDGGPKAGAKVTFGDQKVKKKLSTRGKTFGAACYASYADSIQLSIFSRLVCRADRPRRRLKIEPKPRSICHPR